MKGNKEAIFIENAINKMFEIAGHEVRYVDIKNSQEAWYQKYTMTKEQEETWKQWFLKEVVAEKIINKSLAEKEFMWFNLSYGLKISDR